MTDELTPACRDHDPELWFPLPTDDTAYAQRICYSCPLVDPCAERGMFERFGIWGGLTERDREKMRAGGRRALAGVAS